jgi:hypothetical protein
MTMAVRSGLAPAARDWPLVIAEGTDTASLTRAGPPARTPERG